MKRCKRFGVTACLILISPLFAVAQRNQTQGNRPQDGRQRDDWVRIDRPHVSFDYPADWQIDEQTANDGEMITVAEPGMQHGINVIFKAGISNNHDILNQCASVDKLLDAYYQQAFAPLATGTNQYPYTTVTHDDFQPGPLGGRSTQVSIVHIEAYQNPMTKLAWIEAVPRADGIYLVVYVHPSEPEDVWVAFRKKFLDSIVFKSKPLDRDAYCNYLAK